MRILVDAMGGDFAPFEIVKGVNLSATLNPDIEIILVGDENKINDCFQQLESKVPNNVSIVHTDVFNNIDKIIFNFTI